MILIRSVLIVVLLTGCSVPCWAQTPLVLQAKIAQQVKRTMSQFVPSANSSAPINWQMKTLGGKQFWSDVHHRGGWRIQQNAVTAHFRLLDPNDVRFAWGQRVHCERELRRQASAGKVSANKKHVVILLHGLVGTRAKMSDLETQLSASGEFQTINVAYSSSQRTIAENAKSLHQLISGLGDEVERIDFVAHSMGNLVIRRYLHDQTNQKTGEQGDVRIGRIVMLGPPNQGSRVAEIFKDNVLFQTFAGVGGQELSTNWPSIKDQLATPRQEFGIIAGAQASQSDFNNILLRGRDDYTVSLAETRLAGAADTFEWPMLHAQIVSHPKAIAATERFLKYGYFESPKKRPIPRDTTNMKSNDQNVIPGKLKQPADRGIRSSDGGSRGG